jgi:hypothetical protein
MRLILNLLALACAGMLCGCAGYKLGPTGGQKAGERSIQVVPFLNETLEPRLTDSITAALRKELQRDGTFRLETRESGDIVLSGKVTHYQRRVQSLAPRDLATGRDYRLELTAQVTARDRLSGKALLEKPVTASTLVRVQNDLMETERQALPLLSRDLALRVVSELADGGW